MYSVYETCIFDLYGTLVDIRTDESSPLLWEKMTLFYACYGAQYLPDELRQSYERLVDTFGRGKKGIRNDAHESHPEIRIEDVFSALFSEKGISADESLVRQAGQFFRILSIEHIRLFSQNLSISIIFCLREPLWSETTGYAILKGRKEPDFPRCM